MVGIENSFSQIQLNAQTINEEESQRGSGFLGDVQHRNIKSRVIRTNDGGRSEMAEGTAGLLITKTNRSNGNVVNRSLGLKLRVSLHLRPNVTASKTVNTK